VNNPIILADNILDGATLTPSSTAPGSDIKNVIDWRQYTFWLANRPGNATITIDALTPKTADTIGIDSHNLSGQRISIEGSHDAMVWDTVLASTAINPKYAAIVKMPANHKLTTPMYGSELISSLNLSMEGIRQDPLTTCVIMFTARQYRYWRISLICPDITPRLGIVCLGRRLEFPKTPLYGFSPQDRAVAAESNRSDEGFLLGNVIKYYPFSVGANFSYLEAAFIWDEFMPFYEGHARALKPFFWVFDYSAIQLTVISTDPRHGQQGVEWDKEIEAEFSLDIDPETVSGVSFIIETLDGVLHVESTDPANGAINVPAAARIYMNFDADIDPESVSRETILVAYEEGGFNNKESA